MNIAHPLAELKPHKLTVDDYLALGEQGHFDMCGRIELLDGLIYEMNAQTTSHVYAKNNLAFRLAKEIEVLALPLQSLVEATVKLEPRNAPDIDIIICGDAKKGRYFTQADIRIAIEVAVSTLETDLHVKKALYAQANIAEYWVVDVEAGQIHQFWEPVGEDYAQAHQVPFGQRIDSATIPRLGVETAGIA